jgi:hypothetical protein
MILLGRELLSNFARTFLLKIILDIFGKIILKKICWNASGPMHRDSIIEISNVRYFTKAFLF